MNTNPRIPLAFVQPRKKITWREVEVGVQEQWLSPMDAVALAVVEVERGEEHADVIALASVFSKDEVAVPGLISNLVGCNPGNSELEARLTWMRILLAWFYENRSSFADPLGIVEEIYADFGYPDEIRYLVRYNPPAKSVSEDSVGNSAMLRKWAEYLAATLAIVAPVAPKTR